MIFFFNDDFIMSEKMDFENVYWKEEDKIKLENMIVDLVLMKKYKVY